MKSFKKYVSEAIIDIPRNTYAEDVFNDAGSTSPKLKPNIIKAINDGLKPFEQITGVIDYQLIGSILTHRYRDDADLDINCLFDIKSPEVLDKLRELAWKNNGKEVKGTKHPVNYFVVSTRKEFIKAGEMADGIFDINKNKFIKVPKETSFDISNYLDQFQKEVESIDVVKGELSRDIIDYKELSSLGNNEIDNLKGLLAKKTKEIESSINDLVSVYKVISDERRKGFTDDMTPEQIKKYGNQQRLPKNIIYKMLEKYYYFEFIHKLEDIIGDDKKLNSDELKQLAK
jgi:hypothetical protein